MRLPESQRFVVPVLKVDICSAISIDFIRSCGRIRDFVSFLVKIIIAVRKQHCSALLFLAERRMLCTPVVTIPFMSTRTLSSSCLFHAVRFQTVVFSVHRVQKCCSEVVPCQFGPALLVHKLCKIPTKLRYLWGVLFVLNFLFQHLGF